MSEILDNSWATHNWGLHDLEDDILRTSVTEQTYGYTHVNHGFSLFNHI